jgi:hypothetical protein
MAWELVAIWLITGLSIILFRRSEAQRRGQALARRARAFAVDPVYRHKGPLFEPATAPQPAGLSPADRVYLKSLIRRGLVQR